MTTDRFHEAQPPPKGRLPLVPIGSRSALRILRRPILGETEPTQYSHHIVPIAHRAGRRLLQIKSADDKQRMMHFISHVDAECFISLLKIMDPKPDDYRARAEYKR